MEENTTRRIQCCSKRYGQNISDESFRNGPPKENVERRFGAEIPNGPKGSDRRNRIISWPVRERKRRRRVHQAARVITVLLSINSFHSIEIRTEHPYRTARSSLVHVPTLVSVCRHSPSCCYRFSVRGTVVSIVPVQIK